MKREVELWDYDSEREQLRPFGSPHEAIEDWFDTFWIPNWDNLDEPKQDFPIPRTKKVYGYTRMVPSRSDITDLVEMALENLDEEYADPCGYDHTEPTEAMREAEKVFKDAILAEYRSWMMDRVATEEVDVVEWARENASDLFDRIKWAAGAGTP